MRKFLKHASRENISPTVDEFKKWAVETEGLGKSFNFAAIKATALNAAMNAIASFGIGMAIQLAINAIDDLVHAQERAIEKANEFISTVEEQRQSLSDNKNTIDSIKDDYERLADGVNVLGENVSLSTEEYTRYNEITNQIADMFPQLIQGYTDEGNAIIKHKGNVEELTAAYREQAEAYKATLITGSNDAYEGMEASIGNNATFIWQESGAIYQKQLAEDLLDVLNSGNREEISEFLLDAVNTGDQDNIANELLLFEDLMQSAGIEGVNAAHPINSIDELIENSGKIAAVIKQLTSEINTEVAKITPITQALVEITPEFESLPDDVQSIISQIISQLDGDFYLEHNFDPNEISSWIVDNVITRFNNTDGESFIKNIGLMMDVQTQFNNSEITVDEYQEKINEITPFLETFMNDLPEDMAKNLQLILGITFNESGNIESDIDSMIENVRGSVDSTSRDRIGSLGVDELETASNVIDELPEGTILSWEELVQKIVEYNEAASEATSTTEEATSAFSDFFAKLEEASSGIGSLNSAFAEFDENGTLSFSTLKNINEEFANVEGIDEYVDKLSSAELTSEELNSILSELTYQQLSSKLGVENLTSSNQQYIAKLLEEQGVLNSVEVAEQVVARAKAETKLQTELLTVSTTDEILALADVAIQAGITGNAFYNLVVDIGILNNTNLDLSDKILALQELGFYADWTAQKISNISNVKSFDISGKSGVATYDSDGNLIGVDLFNNLANSQFKSSEYTPTIPQYSGYTPSSSSGSSTADGAKKASDALDNYNRSVEDNAEKLSDAEDQYAKAVEDANERRQDAYEKYNDTIADIEESLEELNKEERLANLQYEIELVNQELEKFGDQLSMLDTQIDMSFEGDYVYKLQAIGTQFKVASEYSADLRSEIDKLINTMPANADEANALADQLESLGEQYYENQRAIIEYRKEANDARASMIEEMADLSTQQTDRLSSIIDRSFNIMENGSIVGDFFALPLVRSVSKDAVDRQRDENDRLIEEEKRYREEIAKIRTNATVMEKQEDDAEREKKRAEYQQQALDAKAELDETLASIDETMANAHDTLLSTVSDIETSLNDSFDSYSDSVDGAVQTTKKAINDIINYADSAEISIDVQSYVQNVEDKYNGESIDHKASGGAVSGNAIVNEEGLESVILPNGTFRVLKNGEKMVAHFPRGSHILNARDTSEILKTGIKDGDKIPQYADGSIGYSSISSNSGNRISEIRASTTTSRKKSKTPGTVIDEIINEIQGAFDNIDVSLDNVKEQVVNEFNDPEWSKEITNQLDDKVIGDYSNDPETGLTSLLLQQSSWDELPENMQTSLSEDLQVTNETWAEWVATPENALIAMQLCREQGVGSWDLLSPTMVEILNTAGINSKTAWDTFVEENPLQALQLLIKSWDALKAQIQQYMDDMIAIATNGAEAIHAIQIEAPEISQASWDNLQTVIANKIQEVLNAINETFKENNVDLNFSINTSLPGNAETNPQGGTGGTPQGNALVETAKQYIGVPYLWGGTTPSGFDCSGFVQYVYAQNGIDITRTTYTQWDNDGVFVSKDELRQGDLVYFGNSSAPHHVGMYIGNGQYIHAPSPGDVVKISDLNSRSDFAGAKRIINSYYTGTGGAKSGYATVGDGNAVKGDFKNPAPELIFKKSGGAYLAGLNGTEIVHLDAGDTVVPHEETMRILKKKNASVSSGRFNSYARGTSSNNAQTTDLSSWSADELGRTDLVDIPKLSESQIASLIEQFFSSSGSVVTTSDAYGIYQAQNQTGMSALAILAIGALESGWGTSSIANTKGNLWGWGATNVNPMGNAKTFSSNTGDAAMEYASNFMSLYYDERGAKSIYAVGTGDNPSGLGYAYYDSGGIDSRWFTQVSSIMAQLAHAVDGMGYLYTGNSNRSGSSYNRIYNLILQKLNELIGAASTNTDTGGMKWSGYKRLSGRQSNYDFDTPFTNLNKRADGGIIDNDNTTIVNELGEESVEHADGTIESLGKIPRLYKLRKGDKVYNAKDTAYLKKYLGNNLERAKVQKLASGSDETENVTVVSESSDAENVSVDASSNEKDINIDTTIETSDSDTEAESSIDYVAEINEILSGDDKIAAGDYTDEQLEKIYNVLSNLREDENVTHNQLDKILETTTGIDEIDKWLTTEYEDLLNNIDKNITLEYQMMESDYHFWQNDFSERFRDFLNNGNHESVLFSDYFAFAEEAYNKGLNVTISQAEMAMDYVKQSVASLEEQLEKAYILLETAVTAEEQARILDLIGSLSSDLQTQENKYNDYAESIQTAVVSRIQSIDNKYVNAMSYEEKHIEDLQHSIDNEDDSSRRYEYIDEQLKIYQRMYDLSEKRAEEAHQRQLDLYNSEDETTKWLLQNFKLDEIFDANGDFNSKYEQTLAELNSYVEDGKIGAEYVQAFKTLALQTQENKKIWYESNDTMENILDSVNDIKNEQVNEKISMFLDIQEKRLENYEFELNKQNLEYDARSALYDFQQTLEQNKLDAQVELTANKELEQWLDPETRKLLFNDDDYSEYTSGIDQINREIQADYEDYINTINSLTPEESYREAEITAQWERQLEIKQEELEVLQDEMNVAKKTLEYNNAAKERDTQIILGNRVVNVADPERLHDLAMEREELINQASLNQMTHDNNSELRDLETLSNVTETIINEIQSRIDMINEMTDAEKEAWAKSLPTVEFMELWWKNLAGTAVRGLNEFVMDFTEDRFSSVTRGNRYDSGIDYQAYMIAIKKAHDMGLISDEEYNYLINDAYYSRNEKTATSKDYAQYYNGKHPEEYGSVIEEMMAEYESSNLTDAELYNKFTADIQEIIDHANLHGAVLTDDELQQLKDLETKRNIAIIEGNLDAKQTSDYGGSIIYDSILEVDDGSNVRLNNQTYRANFKYNSDDYIGADVDSNIIKVNGKELNKVVQIIGHDGQTKYVMDEVLFGDLIPVSDYASPIATFEVSNNGTIKINGVEYAIKSNASSDDARKDFVLSDAILGKEVGDYVVLETHPAKKENSISDASSDFILKDSILNKESEDTFILSDAILGKKSTNNGEDFVVVDKITSGELIPLSESEIENKLSALMLPTVDVAGGIKLNPSIFITETAPNGASSIQRDINYAYNFGDIIITNPVSDANDIVQELAKKIQEQSIITNNMTMN